VLSPEDVGRLLDAAPGPGLKYKAALSIAYGAGLRGGEVVMLRVSDIDSKRMLIRVEVGVVSKTRLRHDGRIRSECLAGCHRNGWPDRPEWAGNSTERARCPPRLPGPQARCESSRRLLPAASQGKRLNPKESTAHDIVGASTVHPARAIAVSERWCSPHCAGSSPMERPISSIWSC
jgi:hypothetical protein